MKIIEFQSATGNNYEIQVDADEHTIVPKWIYEDSTGKIHDPIHEDTWDSLAEMTHDLQIEIVDWGTDIGD